MTSVVIFMSQGKVSGAESVLLELLRGEAASVVGVACPAGSDLDERVRKLGVPTYDFGVELRAEQVSASAFVRGMQRSLWSAFQILRTVRPALAHVFLPVAIKAAVPAAVALRVPAVVSVHDVLTADAIGWSNAHLNRWLAWGAHDVIAVSDFIKATLVDGGYPSSRITTLHNGVDAARFAVGDEVRWSVRDRLGVPPQAVLFLVAGRVTQGKGQDVAIEAVRELRRRTSRDVRLLVLGSPFVDSDRTFAETLRATAGMGERSGWVRFEPATAAVADYYAASDVVLVPSTQADPFPTVVLEAGASARPVVASSLGGAREAIVAHKTGLVVPPSAGAFADAMEPLLDDGKRLETGLEAREHIVRSFSADAYRRGMLEVWRRAAPALAAPEARPVHRRDPRG